MPRQKPLVPPSSQLLGSSKNHYKLTGLPYKATKTQIKLTPLKNLSIAILLVLPYMGLIYISFSFNLAMITTILIVAGISIGGVLGLLYYLNREEPVKAPSNQKKRH